MINEIFKTLALMVIIIIGVISLSAINDHMLASNTRSALSSVVKINNNCSAIVINGDRLLTAAHCVKDDKNKKGSFKFEEYTGTVLASQQEYFYDFIKSDEKKDLALLSIRDKSLDLPVINIASSLKANEGDEVFAIGYPGGYIRTITSGLYNGKQVLGEIIRTRSTPAIFGGNSGGALLQRTGVSYELIGVTSAVLTAGLQTVPHMNLSVTLEDIKEFLKDAK